MIADSVLQVTEFLEGAAGRHQRRSNAILEAVARRYALCSHPLTLDLAREVAHAAAAPISLASGKEANTSISSPKGFETPVENDSPFCPASREVREAGRARTKGIGNEGGYMVT